MRKRFVHTTIPDPAAAEKAARADRDARRDLNYRPGHASYVPAENLVVSVARREGGYLHKAIPGPGGGGTSILSGDELECAKFLFPQIIDYATTFQHAQAVAELSATKEAIESAAELFRRGQSAKSKSLSMRESASEKSAAEREAALAVRERDIAARERRCEERAAHAENALAALTARIRDMAGAKPLDFDD
jgi:hypothetical protein